MCEDVEPELDKYIEVKLESQEETNSEDENDNHSNNTKRTGMYSVHVQVNWLNWSTATSKRLSIVICHQEIFFGFFPPPPPLHDLILCT